MLKIKDILLLYKKATRHQTQKNRNNCKTNTNIPCSALNPILIHPINFKSIYKVYIEILNGYLRPINIINLVK